MLPGKLFVASLSILLVQVYSYQDAPIVLLKQGTAIGQRVYLEDNGVNVEVYSYLGIPYALPPIGPLRFKKPVEAGEFKKVYEFIERPPPCPPNPHIWTLASWIATNKAFEDCLYLNIWTPKMRPNRKFPVMVKIHGGGFQSGSGETEVHQAPVLAGFNEVIVVTLNYRLGIFGFLYSGSEDAPGNMGLHDQILALKWVRDNIKAFGGDPDQVTIFGESCGGISVGLHLLSPLSQGLFKRAILESGTPLVFGVYSGNDPEKVLKVGNKISESAGCLVDGRIDVDCLRTIPQDDLVKVYVNEYHKNANVLATVKDGDFIPEKPIDLIKSGKFKKTEVLIGTALVEWSMIAAATRPNLHGKIFPKDLTKTEAMKLALEEATQWGRIGPLEELKKILENYFENVDENDYQKAREAYINFLSDHWLTCTSVFFAEQLAQHGNTVFYYQFSHDPNPNTWLKSSHFDHVQFVFGMPFLHPENYTDTDRTLSRRVMKLWTNFAKNGTPDDKWPFYNNQTKKIIDISTNEIKEKVGPRLEFCELWRKIYMGVDPIVRDEL